MTIENGCPQCGAELAANAPRGLCPACLLKGALASQTSATGDSQSASGDDFVPPTPEQLAAQFPDLEILEFIGRGGMGMVYKARQKHLDRFVALKILLPSIAQDAAFAERFAREARAMAMLSHPHIVAVHDFGHKDSLYFFLMEFVDGLTLRQLLDAGTLAPQEALAIVPQICEALQYAHDAGIVHRDIKPENILLDKQGQVKIADFGLAKLVGQGAEDFTLTGAGQVMGTPHYMAPEQTEHPLSVDHRADIYSLGVVFYQMLTGELPIGRFAPPSQKVQIDVRLDEVVLRALKKEPELRYQQASEMKTKVETIVTTPAEFGATGSADGASSTPVIDDARRQVQAPAIGLLVLGILGLLTSLPLFAAMIYFSSPAEDLPVFVSVLVPLAVLLPGLIAAFSSFTIIAALKMKRLEVYGLAVTASILAILISPTNLISLGIGIWSLVVLCRLEVVKAFEQKRAMQAELCQPITGFRRAMGIGGLVLCLASFPLALQSIVGHSWFFVFAIFAILQVIALVLGILGRRSLPGKVVAIVSGGLLIVLGSLLVSLTAKSFHRDFGGWPSLQRLDHQDSAHDIEAQISRAVLTEQETQVNGPSAFRPLAWVECSPPLATHLGHRKSLGHYSRPKCELASWHN
jgi:tRNA A-37 threonylcarbamoyl transferase component Bud32